MHRYTPPQHTSKVFSHSSRADATRLPPPPIPALLNSRWTWSVSWSSATARWNASTSRSWETSATKVVTRVSGGASCRASSRVWAMFSAESRRWRRDSPPSRAGARARGPCRFRRPSPRRSFDRSASSVPPGGHGGDATSRAGAGRTERSSAAGISRIGQGASGLLHCGETSGWAPHALRTAFDLPELPRRAATTARSCAGELALARAADQLGFDSYWATEHHFFGYSMCPDNLQWLAQVAACTQRIRSAPAP